MSEKSNLYGIVAQFQTPGALVAAANSVYAQGFRAFDTYAPFEIEVLKTIPLFQHSSISRWTLSGGLLGGIGGFGMQYYANVISYPQNVAGHPLNSWPAFIPITFALTILCAALATVLGIFVLNQLPALHHPIFNFKEFHFADGDRFFLCVKASDQHFETSAVSKIFVDLGALRVSPVEVQS